METNLVLHGQSPAIPLDLILQSLAQASFSGALRAVQADGRKLRLLFIDGRVCAPDAVQTVRDLLARPTVWGVEPIDVPKNQWTTVDVQGVLMEVARLNDEAARLALSEFAGGACGC